MRNVNNLHLKDAEYINMLINIGSKFSFIHIYFINYFL